MPNEAQRAVLVKYGAPVLGAAALLILPLLPSMLDCLVGMVGMGAAALGGYRYAQAA